MSNATSIKGPNENASSSDKLSLLYKFGGKSEYSRGFNAGIDAARHALSNASDVLGIDKAERGVADQGLLAPGLHNWKKLVDDAVFGEDAAPKSAAPSEVGSLITLEGGEGVGKSTQLEFIREALSMTGRNVVVTREPGGTELAEKIRSNLLGGDYSALTSEAEAVMFAAARIDHMAKTILPALQRGDWVVCDRFYDSTRAYQGAAGSVAPENLTFLERAATAGRPPDLTIIFDLPVKTAMTRAAARRGNAAPDRFEGEGFEFHGRLRLGFLEIAKSQPERCRVIDCEGLSKSDVSLKVLEILHQHLVARGADFGDKP